MLTTLSLVWGYATPVSASQGPEPWQSVAQDLGISWTVLYGIALSESARPTGNGNVAPWPWTVNSQAAGPRYFNTRDEAARHIRFLISEGHRNIDIGLMQLNWHYHGHRTGYDVDKLLDPWTNVRVAGSYLDETLESAPGDVMLAVARYHNWNKERGLRYSKRVFRYAKAVERQH